MAKNATLAIKIVGDANSGIKALDQTESRLGGISGKALAVAGVLGGAAAAIGGVATAAFTAASDLEQSTGAINSVFGDWAIDIEQSAQKAAGSVGLSTSAYEELASVLGAQLSGTGMNIGDVTDKTQDLVKMGADLAATFGGSTADAVSALSGVLKGETDPIERYGVSIKQSDINARLAAQGQDKLTGSALKQATAQAALALVTEQTAKAHGAFARESDTAAGSGARASAMWDNLMAKLGAGLLPIFVTLTSFVTDNIFPALDGMFAKGSPLSGMFASLGGFISTKVVPAVKDLFKWGQENLLPIFASIGRFIHTIVIPAFMRVWSIVQTYVIPIFKTVLTPVLQGIRGVWEKVTTAISSNAGTFDRLFKAAQPVFAFLRDKVAPFIGGTLKVAWTVLGTAIGVVVDLISWVVDKIAWLIEKGTQVAHIIGDLFGPGGDGGGGVYVPPPATAPAMTAMYGAAPLRASSLFASAGGASGPASAGRGSFAGGDVYHITVTGALDPSAVADQIADMLDRRARRIGTRLAGALR